MDHRASPGTFRFPLFPSQVERGFAAARSSQGRARQRAAKPRLTARTDAKQSRGEGKSHFLICFTHYEVRIPIFGREPNSLPISVPIRALQENKLQINSQT